MNIKILDSWLREYLQTKASAKQIAECLSLTSVSVDKVEKYKQSFSANKDDYIYDIEVTTNRPDLMSVISIAHEAYAVLEGFGIESTFKSLSVDITSGVKQPRDLSTQANLNIQNDPKLVNRICAAILEVEVKASPQFIKERLEGSGIRSLNNLIDITNYVMREIGHPAHVFDYDRLNERTLIIRESKKGEKTTTLDGKTHILFGQDIVADNGRGEIVDLLGVMGCANSVVTNSTRRILFFIDNNEPLHIRKTSMSQGIRSEAAILNEKGIDPELSMKALLRGIELYKQEACGKLISQIIDIYPNKPKSRSIKILQDKINSVIGVTVPIKKTLEILSKLGFETKINGSEITVKVPSSRLFDVAIPEDLIEEIARIYGYHRIPTKLPPLSDTAIYQFSNEFYWERRIKNLLKHSGFLETYTYSMVSQDLLEQSASYALSLKNPLSEDMAYLRQTLVPSLLLVLKENERHEKLKIFEIAYVYHKRKGNLPKEVLTLAAVVKKPNITFLEIKGLVETLLNDLQIKDASFRERKSGGLGADVYINNEFLGEIEILDENIADFELDFNLLIKFATLKKVYKPVSKYPPIIEDVRLLIDPNITYSDIVSFIKKQSPIIANVELVDLYQDKKTFRITYQNPQKNLSNEEVTKIREKLYNSLNSRLRAKIS